MNQRIAHVDAAKKLILGVYIYGPDYVPTASQMLESAALAAGYTYAPPEPAKEPTSIDLWRIRAALELLGFMPRVQAYIQAQPDATRIVLENLTEYYVEPIDTNSPVVKHLFSCLTVDEYKQLLDTAQSITV